MTIREIMDEIDSLPRGYISNKTINGKVRHYLQWTENGRIKSKYIKDSEYEDIKAKVERRQELQRMLKAAPEPVGESSVSDKEFEMNVITGKKLDQMVSVTSKLDVRKCFSDIEEYIYGPVSPRIMVVYGLRRTGKTTLLFQTINRMNSQTRSKTFYIKAQRGQTMSSLYKDLNRLSEMNYKYAFIDEITFIDDFIDTAAVLPDLFASMGMKIVISGTDSLGLWLASKNELYDRTFTIHTTWISFAEHARLLHTNDVDDYIRYGGTLRAGEYNFDDPELQDESVSFRDDESTRRYIDTAICRNIQHSLKCYESGSRFMHLQELYEADELTNAINRIIEDMNHRFVLSVLTDDFSSDDFSLAKKNLTKEKEPSLRSDALNIVNREEITQRLMEILKIKNKSETEIELLPVHIKEIKAYLEALDLVEEIPVRYAYSVENDREEIAITQPGMRYSQAEALVWSLKKDRLFEGLPEKEKNYVTDKILDEVKGRMLEEIVLSETKKALSPKEYDVFKYQFVGGEIDMVVYDKEADSCRLFEIKHSKKAIKDQCRHLLNEEECKNIERLYGKISERNVIYNGKELEAEWGVKYLNASDYLISL